MDRILAPVVALASVEGLQNAETKISVLKFMSVKEVTAMLMRQTTAHNLSNKCKHKQFYVYFPS